MKRFFFGFTMAFGLAIPSMAAAVSTSPDLAKDENPVAAAAAAPKPTTGPIQCSDVPIAADGSVNLIAYANKVGSTRPVQPMSDTPACPTVTHCADAQGCSRCHGVNCSDIDTGETNCLLTPNVLFHCPNGTIHISACNMCDGLCTVGHACVDGYSQTWSCQ